jgi:hypothetical protein
MELFPLFLEDQIEYDSLLVAQDDPIGAYVALTLAMIIVLRERSASRERHRSGWRAWRRRLDQFKASSRSRRQLLEGLVFDAFDAFTDVGRPVPVGPPAVGTILARVSGAWVGEALSGKSESVGRSHAFVRRHLRRLVEVLHKCIQLDPGRPEYHYRTGALLCLADDPAGAIAAFQSAEPLESFASIDEFSAQAEAELELGNMPLVGEDLRGARYVALLARALNISGGRAQKSLKTDFEKNKCVNMTAISPDRPPTWLLVARQLLGLPASL